MILSHIFEVFHAFLMKTAMICFYIFYLLLAVGNLLEENVFVIPDLDYLVDNINPLILADIELFLHSISILTQPNDLPTNHNPTKIIRNYL